MTAQPETVEQILGEMEEKFSHSDECAAFTIRENEGNRFVEKTGSTCNCWKSLLPRLRRALLPAEPGVPESVNRSKDHLLKIVEPDLVRGEDGDWLYWPVENQGAHTSWSLRAIADELDKRNQSNEGFECLIPS